MRKDKDREWGLPRGASGALSSWDEVNRSLLMDIRDELKLQTAALQSMERTLSCHNTQAIPRTLARIDRRLAKKVPLK